MTSSQMCAMLTPPSRQRVTEAEFRSKLDRDADSATETSLGCTRLESTAGDEARFKCVVQTRTFGTLHEVLQLPFAGSGGGTRVRFAPEILFPGLRSGETLRRDARLGPRGTILAADGTPLAEGPSRSSPIPSVASAIVGTLGPIPADQRVAYAAQGYPANAQVGQDGLELIFQERARRTAGRQVACRAPGAGSRTRHPRATVRTTIVPRLEQAAIDAIGTSYAGLTVLSRTGAIEAAAGIAFTDVQPPGSTMKIVTATAALQAGIVKLDHGVSLRVERQPRWLQDAERGRRDLRRHAAQRIRELLRHGLRAGRRRGRRQAARHHGAAIRVRRADGDPERGRKHDSVGEDDRRVGGCRFLGDRPGPGSGEHPGDGRDRGNDRRWRQATAAEDPGREKPRYVRVTTPKIAEEVQQMMEAVVSFGTGTTAQIPGVTVAGKTGTAELGSTVNQADNKALTDSWFVGYAPAGSVKAVSAALFPSSGYGADVAAPAVKQVLEAALGVTG